MSPAGRGVAVVSGAAGGIGRAIVARLAGDGYAVLALDREARDFGGILDGDGRPAVTAAWGDVRDEGHLVDVRRAADAAGGASVLVGAAGAYPRHGLRALTPDRFRSALDVNLTAQYALARTLLLDAVRPLRSIVFVGSVLARAGRHELGGYIAAKAGLEGLTRAMARELGPEGTRVNCVAPGSIAVPAERDAVPDIEAAVARQMQRQALKRRGTPEDVAGLVSFLCGEDSAFITGQTITVDGGWQLV